MKTYEKNKSSGIEWMGDIPEHWEVTRIKYTPDSKPLSFIDGDWIESKNIVFDEEIRYITTGNIGEGVYKVQGHSFITEDTFSQLNCTEVFPGDLLISRLNKPIGRSCIIPDLGFRIVTAVDNVIYRPNKSFDKRYLNFLMNNSKYYDYTELIARGATMQRISRGLLAEIKICVAPLQEQTAIANFLDTKTTAIDQSIADKENLINLLEEEKKALINEAVTKGLNQSIKLKHSGVDWLGEIPIHWQVVPFTKYLHSIIDYRGRTPDKIDDGVFLVTARNIKGGKIDYSLSEEFVSEREAEHLMKRGEVQLGDVLFTTEAPLGEVANVDRLDICLAQRIIKFRAKPDFLNNYFLKHWLRSYSFQQDLHTYATGSTALGIKSSKLTYLKILIPPIAEQNQIVDYIEVESQNIATKINTIKEEITLLKEYRQALIFEAVTGKIDVRGFKHTA